MAKIFYIDDEYPLEKDLVTICKLLEQGATMAFPTDTVYAVGCAMNHKSSIDKVLNIVMKMNKKTKMTILCSDIKMAAAFTLPMSTVVFTTIKQNAPGPCTFILNANNHLSKFFKSNKKEIGVRIPSSPILTSLLKLLNVPIISTSLVIPEASFEENNDADFIVEKLNQSVDVIIHSPIHFACESSIIDCTGNEIILIREGVLPIKGAII